MHVENAGLFKNQKAINRKTRDIVRDRGQFTHLMIIRKTLKGYCCMDRASRQSETEGFRSQHLN